MSSHIFTVPDSVDCKKAYTAAILEKDKASVVRLIEQARQKLSCRLQELTLTAWPICGEIEAIHDAFYLLKGCKAVCSIGMISAFPRLSESRREFLTPCD